MKKALLLVLSLSLAANSFPQRNLQTIKASSPNVDIRVDDDYFVKGGWILDPAKKPDIFSIGSKWLYQTKKVSFITDIDSISVNIQPNSQYDFIVLLNETTPCYIQIKTLSNPIFMNKRIVIPLLSGLIIILMLLYVQRKRLDNAVLLYVGYAAPLFFWGMTFLSGYIHGNYNHFKNVISELGAIGTTSELLTSSVLTVLSVLCTLFSIGFYRTSQQLKLSVIPAILSFCMPITMIWAAIFTLGNEFHGFTGALPFLLILGFLLAYLLWKSTHSFIELSKISLLCFLISALILLRLLKPFGYEYEGLIQRFFYLAWTIWTVSVAHHLSKKLRAEKQ